MKKELLIILAIGFICSGITVTEIFAQEDGSALLEERCSICHPSARPKSKQKTPEQWDATVSRMMGKGAKLSQEEKQVLLDYLGKTYKP